MLFTLSARAEARRKGMDHVPQAPAIFQALIDRAEEVCSRLPGVDLLVASPAGMKPRRGQHLPQRGRGFDSLEQAVADAFALGYRRVLAVGNDAPHLSAGYLVRAIDRLASLDDQGLTGAVIGPAEDGGYALLGLTRHCPAAFRHMRWGSASVAATTGSRLRDSGFHVLELPTIGDVDSFQELKRFLVGSRRCAPWSRALARLLAARRDHVAERHRAFEHEPLRQPSLRAPPAFS